MKTTNLNGIPSAETYLWQIGTERNPISGGLNTADLEYMLGDNQSPMMKNLWYDGRVLGKRPGQEWTAELSGEVWRVTEYQGELIAATGTGLYKMSAPGPAAATQRTPETKKQALPAGKAVFFAEGEQCRVSGGAEGVTEASASEPDDKGGQKTARIRVFKCCTNLIRCLPQVQFDSKNPNDMANEPHELTHSVDALRYFCAGRPLPAARPREPDEEEPENELAEFLSYGV